MTQPKVPSAAGLFGIKIILLSTALACYFLLSFFVGFHSVYAEESKERWEFVGASQTGTRWYIDKETFSGSSGISSFWVRSVPDKRNISNEEKENSPKGVLRDIQERNFGDYEYTEALWQIDCANVKLRILYFAVYGSNGEMLNYFLSPDAQWASVMQGSVGETLRGRVCGDNIN